MRNLVVMWLRASLWPEEIRWGREREIFQARWCGKKRVRKTRGLGESWTWDEENQSFWPAISRETVEVPLDESVWIRLESTTGGRIRQ